MRAARCARPTGRAASCTPRAHAANAAQGLERRADDGARQAPVPRHARRDRRDRRAGARPELPRPGVGAAACMSTTATACAWGRARSSCGRNSGCRTTPRTRSTWAWNWRTPRSRGSLGKRYVQDQPLDWGCAVEAPAQDLNAWCAPGTTLAQGRTRATTRGTRARSDDERPDLRDRASPRWPPTAACTSRRWACATRRARWC